MVRNGAVIDLDSCLVVFGNEDCLVGTVDFTNPNVVVIVGVFYDLNGRPFLRFGVKFLLSDGSQAVPVVPRVEFAVRGTSVTLNIGKSSTYLPRIHAERNPAVGAGKTD